MQHLQDMLTRSAWDRVLGGSKAWCPFCTQGPYLAGYTAVDSEPLSYGLQRLDHAVGNVHDLEKAVNYIAKITGFHEFAEFTAEVRVIQAPRSTPSCTERGLFHAQHPQILKPLCTQASVRCGTGCGHSGFWAEQYGAGLQQRGGAAACE